VASCFATAVSCLPAYLVTLAVLANEVELWMPNNLTCTELVPGSSEVLATYSGSKTRIISIEDRISLAKEAANADFVFVPVPSTALKDVLGKMKDLPVKPTAWIGSVCLPV